MLLTLFVSNRELDNDEYSEERALETFHSLSLSGDGKLSLPEMEAILRRQTKEVLEEDEINTVNISSIVCLLLTLFLYQVMKLLEEIKDKSNQFDLGKLCSIMTED